jgi:diguanylate cyclase (GGDEF)-like protein
LRRGIPVITNFVYLNLTMPDTHLASLWMFLVPLPTALLFGVAEGIFWIGISTIGSMASLWWMAQYGQISITYVYRFGFIYLVLSLLAVTVEYVRKSIQDLYVEKQNELLHFNENISEKVLLDSLTGAYNRGFLTELFPGLLQFAVEADTPLTILLCDIDQFKVINDLNGHVQGDRVLKTVAQLLMENLRSATDNLVRYGGDEFLVVLRNAEIEGAARLAERLRIKIENLTFPEVDEGITCSFGVAELAPTDFAEEGKDAAVVLVARADKCLYQAKQQGKNQVVALCRKA